MYIIMKSVLSIFLTVCVLGCGDDNVTNTRSKASRNIMDYMFSGEEGTEYWTSIQNSRIDTNGITKTENRDTAIYRILNRNYLHPIFGSCLRLAISRIQNDPKRIDTLCLQIKEGTIYSVYSNVSGGKTEYLELLKSPIQQGTVVNNTAFPMVISDLDVPIVIPAGSFNTIVMKGEKPPIVDEISVFKSTRETYFAEGVMFCKSVEKNTLTYKKNNKAVTYFSEQQLILIKKN